MNKYLTRKQVVKCYPISLSHLAHMASDGKGPRYRIIGKSAIYSVVDVEAWLEAQVIEPTSMPITRKRGRPRKQLSALKISGANDNG